MNKKIVSVLTFFLVTAPIAAIAATPDFGTPPAISTNSTQANAILFINNTLGFILDIIWIVFIAFAVIMFLVAGFQFLSAQGEPDGVSKARKSLIWGSIGVVVAVAAFVLPFIVRSYLQL